MDNPFDIILAELKSLREAVNSMPTISAPLPPEIINSDEICKRLDISEPTLTKWRLKKKIPFIKQDGIIRYNWTAVVQTLEKKTK